MHRHRHRSAAARGPQHPGVGEPHRGRPRPPGLRVAPDAGGGAAPRLKPLPQEPSPAAFDAARPRFRFLARRPSGIFARMTAPPPPDQSAAPAAAGAARALGYLYRVQFLPWQILVDLPVTPLLLLRPWCTPDFGGPVLDPTTVRADARLVGN